MFALHYSSPNAVNPQVYGISNTLEGAQAWLPDLHDEMPTQVWGIFDTEKKAYVDTSSEVGVWVQKARKIPAWSPEVLTPQASALEQETTVVLPDATPEEIAHAPL